jgi:hypothetical protein
MARKSLADKIRASGRATQKELEHSKKILKNILEPSSKLNISDRISDKVTDKVRDKRSDDNSYNITDITTDNISDDIAERSIQGVSDANSSVIRSVTPSVTKHKTQPSTKRKSVTSSVTKKPAGFDKALSFHSVFLSKRQLEVYAALLKYGDSGFITQTHISSTTGIPLPTVRQALRVMKDRGVLNYKRYQSEGRKGILFSINTNVKIDQNTDMSVILSVTNSSSNTSPTKSVTKSVTSLISSSSLLNKNTTTLKNIELILSSNPELGYWQELKLKPQQVKKWMDEIQINLEDIVDSLKHCRFDLVDNGLLESKPVRDPLSWLYKRLKQYGYYHAPKGYVSFEDKAIQRAKERLKKKQERAKELEAIRKAELETERKIAFEKMMADPKSELYKRCFSKLNKIEKRLKGKGLVISMRTVFDRLIDEGKVEIA